MSSWFEQTLNSSGASMVFPKIVSLGTAVPRHRVDQRDAARVASDSFSSRFAGFDRLAKVFETAGIRHRYTARPLEWYLGDLDWPERNEAYLEVASDLFVEAAEKALAAGNISAGEIDTVVTISSTGIATPSLESRVASRLGFRLDVDRVPVFGLGCAGGVTGIALGAQLAREGRTVLVVAVELCTLSFRLDKLTKANVVATALFGDGAAACVLRGGGQGVAEIEMSGQYQWPQTMDIMGWSVDPAGLGVIFDRAIPPFAQANLAAAIRHILARADLTLGDIDRFTCHPGGTKVIEAIEDALALGQGALDIERAVLQDYGNMSAPTALFVLDRAIRAGLPNRTLLTALGPGFTVSCVSLRASA